MIVKVGNFYYFLYIAIAVALTLILYFLLRNKSKKVQFYVILGLLFSGFSLHFLKQLMPPYNSDPYSFRKSTFENICAVSTLIFPFIFLSKSCKRKDYMGVIGTLSGIVAFLYPTEAMDKFPFTADAIRFYYCHFVLFISGFLMLKFKFHTLSLKNMYHVFTQFFVVECVILVNEIVLIGAGYVDSTFQELFDPNIRNSSLIFGYPDNIKQFSFFFEPFVFKFMKTNIVTGETMYWPIVWMIVPVFIYCMLLSTMMCFIFSFKQSRDDVINFVRKVKSKLIRGGN